MMKCDAPKRGRGALSAHKGAAFVFIRQLRVFTGELWAHENTRWDNEVWCPEARSLRFFRRARARHLFSITSMHLFSLYSPACSLESAGRI